MFQSEQILTSSPNVRLFEVVNLFIKSLLVMSSVRYDKSKRQAKTCRNLNPEAKNMATLYQTRIQNQREQKQLDAICKGLNEEHKIISAEYHKEKMAIRKDLARLHKATDRYGKPMKRDAGYRNMVCGTDSVTSRPNSRPSAPEKSLDGSVRSRKASNSLDDECSSSSNREPARMYDHSKLQLALSKRRAREKFGIGNLRRASTDSESERFEEERSREWRNDLDDLLVDDPDAPHDGKDPTFIGRWKRLNMLVNTNNHIDNKLPVKAASPRKNSLFETQERESLSRKEQSFDAAEANFCAEDAFKVLNTRYLRLTKLNIAEMEQICRDEGLDVSSMHAHVDERKAKKSSSEPSSV